MMDISLALPWISIAVGIIAISRFYSDRRDRAVEEGKMKGEIAQLRKDLDSANLNIRGLESNARCVDIDLAEVKSDVKHILDALERIERKLESVNPH
jgi:hypothetical protein